MPLLKFFIIFSAIIFSINARAYLKIHIYDYHNYDNVMHNGNKCENFHWAGDHCDPMFRICVSTNYYHNCNVDSKSTGFWANVKTISSVWSKTVEINKFDGSIKFRVTADDHDRYDEHDHIAVFTADFSISKPMTYYKSMTVSPGRLNVGLKVSVQLACYPNYYGEYCQTYCYSNWSKYKCDQTTGKKICLSNYFGDDCETYCNAYHRHYKCDQNGNKICYLNYYGNECDTYCNAFLGNYKCNQTNGNKICISNFYGYNCKTYCDPDKKNYKCDPTNGNKICFLNYYGENCKTYCNPVKGNYECDQTTGNKICQMNCGSSGTCLFGSDRYFCLCRFGWTGTYCNESRPTTKSTSLPSTSDSTPIKTTIASTATTMNSSTIDSLNRETSNENNKTILSGKISSINLISKSQLNESENAKLDGYHRNLRQSNNIGYERNKQGSKISPIQIGLSIIIVILLCIIVWLVSKKWKLQYKLKVLQSNVSHKPLPTIIYERTANSKNAHQYHINDPQYSSAAIPMFVDETTYNDNYDELSINTDDDLTCKTDC